MMGRTNTMVTAVETCPHCGEVTTTVPGAEWGAWLAQVDRLRELKVRPPALRWHDCPRMRSVKPVETCGIIGRVFWRAVHTIAPDREAP